MVIALLVAGCGAAPQTATQAPSATLAPGSTPVTPTATLVPSAPSTPEVPTPSASAAASPSAAPPTGLRWSRVEDGPGFENAKFPTVASLPGILVALGKHGEPSQSDYGGAAAWYSLDGEVWSETALPGARQAVPWTVAHLGEGLVAEPPWVSWRLK